MCGGYPSIEFEKTDNTFYLDFKILNFKILDMS
jgi:hypothetical protein